MASRWRAICGLVVVLAATLARGQPQPESKASDCLKEEHAIQPPQTPGNAAIEYFKVWDSLPMQELQSVCDWGNVPVLQSDPIKLAPAQKELCLKHQDFFEGLMRAAGMAECEWGVQHQLGEDFRLEHLKYLRWSYRALKMDYIRCTEDGLGAAAAARLVAIVRMSDQTRTDAVWFSSLLATGHMYGAFDMTKEFLKSGLITPATARQVLEAYKGIRLDDLFGSVSAMEGERWNLTQWPRKECTGERAGLIYFEKVGGFDAFRPELPEMFLMGRNEPQLKADLDRFDQYLGQTIPLWKDPKSDLKLREMEVEAMEGQYGLVAAVRAYYIEQVRRSVVRARKQIQGVMRDLEAYLKDHEKDGS